MAKKRIFTEEEIQKMIDMYNDGETYSVIGRVVNTKAEKVSQILKDLGYGTRPLNTLKHYNNSVQTRKYCFNENYFEIIDTPNKAYWLGFLYADGYIQRHTKEGKTNGGRLTVTLKTDDAYMLESFLIELESNDTVRNRLLKQGEKTYHQSSIYLSSVKFVEDLIYHGCIQNKSLVLQRPVLNEDLASHFIRGYFDGDGCVQFYPQRYAYSYSVLGTNDVLMYIVESAKLSHYNIRKAKSNSECFELRIFSKEELIRFHQYIYNNKTMFLKRKYDKSEAMMNHFGANKESSQIEDSLLLCSNL